MFRTLVKFQSTQSTIGLESLSDIFKNKEIELKEFRKKSIESLDEKYKKGITEISESIKKAQQHIRHYSDFMENISQQIKDKKLNIQKFNNLTTPFDTYGFGLLSAGLYEINQIYEIILKNLDFEYEKFTPYEFIKGELKATGAYSLYKLQEGGYSIIGEKGTKFVELAYPSNFVSMSISKTKSVLTNIEKMFSLKTDFEEDFVERKQKIEKSNDTKEISRLSNYFDVRAKDIATSIHAVSSEYLDRSMKTVGYIAEHCYD